MKEGNSASYLVYVKALYLKKNILLEKYRLVLACSQNIIKSNQNIYLLEIDSCNKLYVSVHVRTKQ